MLKELELCKRAEARLEQLIVERETAEVTEQPFVCAKTGLSPYPLRASGSCGGGGGSCVHPELAF